MNILFLGYGKMGQALGNAWIENKLVNSLIAVDPMIESNGLNYFNSVDDIPENKFDLVVLAVKPNMAKAVIQNLKPSILENACLISIMAGVETKTLEEAISIPNVPVIRVMPNTPVLAKAGCSILYTSANLDTNLKNQIGALFTAVGYSNWLDNEADLHAVTALSGSGPAYFHLFTEALSNAGEKLGLSKQLAEELAKNTAYGASLLQNNENTDLVQLRKNVTSPNGTTHAAIQEFESEFALRSLTEKALSAAFNRSIELSKV